MTHNGRKNSVYSKSGGPWAALRWQQTIAENRVVIFSKSYCPYCKRAKDLFATNFPDLHVKVLECVSVLSVLLWLWLCMPVTEKLTF
jgi:hypothetical protein